jgi:poly-gamma-glutamate synthesis protein (capsule biosynthesis protein)
MHTARGYVDIAKAVHGPIPKPVDAAYIWGDALEEFARVAPEESMSCIFYTLIALRLLAS